MRERHEDIEDLIGFGATLAEVIHRSGYAGWAGVRTSLKNAGRDDLLAKLTVMRENSDLPPQERKAPAPTCARELCPNKPLYGDLCLFHEGAQYRWCNEPECPEAAVHLNKCEPHYRKDLRSRR